MLRLTSKLSPKYAPRVYVIAQTDEMSEKKVMEYHSVDIPVCNSKLYFQLSFNLNNFH